MNEARENQPDRITTNKRRTKEERPKLEHTGRAFSSIWEGITGTAAGRPGTIRGGVGR